MHILVTGANGFVGSHCLEALAKFPDVTVTAACRSPEKLPAFWTGPVAAGDLRDPAYVAQMLDGVDVVIHAAAWSSLWGNRQRSEQLYLTPSLALIKAAKAAGVSRFVQISSTSVAAPHGSANPMTPGRMRRYWPHEANLVRIENAVRAAADDRFVTLNLRLGIFAGARYGLGLLPILAPRLKTHLVPWVNGGKTGLPIIDGRDIGQAAALAATVDGLSGYDAFNIVGPTVPTVREVFTHLHDAHNLPLPHFSVPFPVAFAFAGLMELIDPITPWEPLVTRSIIHLLQETGADNQKASAVLGYAPRFDWREAIDLQMREMATAPGGPMSLVKPV